MNTKRLVISAICSAVACLSLIAVSYVDYLAVLAVVIASVAVAIPLIVNKDNGKYSTLAYLASVTLAYFMCNKGNIYWVSLVATMYMPITLVIVRCENLHAIAEQRVQPIKARKIAKWVVNFIITQFSVAITLLLTYLFVPAFFEQGESYLLYIIVALLEVSVVLFDRAMRVCIAQLIPMLIRAKVL